MENRWWDKPVTAETVPKLSPNWHVEDPCDWFWLLLDFNIIQQEFIDSRTSACGLSVNCQMRPCLLSLPTHLFTLHFLRPIFPNHKQTVRPRRIGWLRWICRWLSTNAASLLLIVNGCDTVYSALNIAALTLHDHYHREATAASSQQQPPRTSANLIHSYYHHCLV